MRRGGFRLLRIMGEKRTAAGIVIILFCLALAAATAQQSDKKQDIPDAPSASRPPQPFPTNPPVESQGPPAPEPPAVEQPPSGNEAPPTYSKPAPTPAEEATNPTPPPHPLEVKTVPEGGATPSTGSSSQDELFKITRNVNQVIIPVRVTDDSGHLVNGLLPKDFSVLDDGKKVALNFFTSDPLAISAAVIFDLGMPDINVQKVNQTLASSGRRV